MLARRLGAEVSSHVQIPGECELKVLKTIHSNSITVATDEVSTVLASWSIGNSESFDKGESCGVVGDRTTTLNDFGQALNRSDGKGFGNAILRGISYTGAGGVVGTEITSSTVSTISTTSLSGAPGDVPPTTLGYGRMFYTSHVNFADDNGLMFSFPLLFHDPLSCLSEDADLDYYGSAVLGYGEFLNGTVASLVVDDLDDALVVRSRYNAIVLDTESLYDYVSVTQIWCDVGDAPVWTEAGYAMCSDGGLTLTADGELVAAPPIPNVTTSVDGCPVSVLPARFRAVGDFIDGTFESRVSQWLEEFVSVQTTLLVQDVDAQSSLGTAMSIVVQSTTQVGFPLPDANDETEWVLVLVVAVEAVAVVISSLVVLGFRASYGMTRKRTTSRRERLEIFGTAFGLGAFLVLGLIPVFIGWGSESEAADMAHNDVYRYTADLALCGTARWSGDPGFGQWCSTLRTASDALLVRSYASTFKERYAILAISSAILGFTSWTAHCVFRTFFVMHS